MLVSHACAVTSGAAGQLMVCLGKSDVLDCNGYGRVFCPLPPFPLRLVLLVVDECHRAVGDAAVAKAIAHLKKNKVRPGS